MAKVEKALVNALSDTLEIKKDKFKINDVFAVAERRLQQRLLSDAIAFTHQLVVDYTIRLDQNDAFFQIPDITEPGRQEALTSAIKTNLEDEAGNDDSEILAPPKKFFRNFF